MSVTTDTVPVVTSKTSEVYYWGGGKQNPQKLDVFHGGSSALQVCAGRSHYAVVTVEKELFTWANVQGGVAMVGQLGHGDTASYRAPRRVDCLIGTAITQVGCGEEFTACLTEEGKVYACGSDYWGCLGGENEHGDEVMIPVEVEFFSGRPVAQISCGDAHIVVLTREQEVYSWGCGEFGRLGLGSEDDFASPQKVEFCGSKTIKTIHCGPDGTFFLTANGRVLACGTNEHNKLGFNLSASGLVKRKKKISYDIPCKLQPTLVRSLSRYQIVQISAGQTHSAAIDVHGLLITFGSNKFGQLGVGDFKPRRSINVLRGSLMGRQVLRAACGDGFTVAATSDNMIYSWGNGEDGRLGVTSDRGEKGPKGLHPASVSRPRPIFGSLHLASDVSCRHWNTIMVVEKVLQQKTIRSQISTGKAEEVDDSVFGSVCCTSEDGAMSDRDSGVPESFVAPVSSNREVNTVGDSVPPPWLQRELADSDIIPMAGTSAACPDDSVRPPDDSGVDFADCVPEWLKKELEDENYIPMATTNDADTVPVREEENDVEAFAVDGEVTEVAQRVPPDGDEDTSQGHHPSLNMSVEAQLRETIAALQEQLQQLQTDNQQLRDIVSEQNEKIRSLENKSKAHTEVDSQIWALIDQWQEECSEVVGGSRDGRRPRPATCDEAELNGARGQHTCGNEWKQKTNNMLQTDFRVHVGLDATMDLVEAGEAMRACISGAWEQSSSHGSGRKLSIRAVENMNILREATADRQPGSREEKHVNANWNERQSQLSTQKPSSKPPGAAAKKLAGLPRVASWLHTTDHIERRSCQSEQTLRQSWSDTKHVVSTVNKQTIFRQSGSADVILMCRVLRGVALRGSGFGEGPGKAPIDAGQKYCSWSTTSYSVSVSPAMWRDENRSWKAASRISVLDEYQCNPTAQAANMGDGRWGPSH
ncbi:Serine/threonine-protein kinase Nek9 [Branchiostoma belcheri]|nr:Serine/threonine-protein kinase Nek9 [Branchiostoma belcheri]